MDTWITISDRHNRQYRKIEVLAEQQNYRCCYCGVSMLIPRNGDEINRPHAATIEHVQPLGEKGEKGYHNEVAACRICNNLRRSDIPAEEFYEWRLRHPSHNFNVVRRAINLYRKERDQQRTIAYKAAIEKARQDQADAVPVWQRRLSVSTRNTVDLIDLIFVKMFRCRPSASDVVWQIDSDQRKTRKRFLNEFPTLSIGEVRKMRGSTIRTIPQARRALCQHRLLAIPTSPNVYRYPLFQFENGVLMPIMHQILSIFHGRLDQWQIALWFTTPNELIGGKRPVDVMDKERAAVVDAAAQRVGMSPAEAKAARKYRCLNENTDSEVSRHRSWLAWLHRLLRHGRADPVRNTDTCSANQAG